MNDAPVLKIEHLAVGYRVRGGEVEAVRDVSFEIARGECFGLVGESGCGKSTVAWAIVNYLGANGSVKHGSIEFLGQELAGKGGDELRRLRCNNMAMVYQDPVQALNPSMRLGEQMKEVLTARSTMRAAAAEARCLAVLERVHMPDPDDLLRRYPHQISGGQQQRVVIAMALLNEPALLIMDEPTSALDVTVEAAVLDLIAELRRDLGTAILLISHNLGVVARVCSRVGVMYAGEIVESADTRTLLTAPQHPYTQGLLRCVPRLGADKASSVLYPIPGRVPSPTLRQAGCAFALRCDYAQERCRLERPALRALAGGASVRCHFAEQIDPSAWNPPSLPAAPAAQVAAAPPILQLDGLQASYLARSGSLRELLRLAPPRRIRAVDGVSLSVPAGSTFGIVGESGSGKSTLVRTIVGLEASTGGKAEFMGFDITAPLERRDASLICELQMVFQHPDATMNPAYTVGRQIARPLIRFGTVPKQQVYGEVVRLLRAVRLDESYYDRLPRQLSGGEKQRVGIARALASRPGLVLCDEPVSALDVSVQAAILNLLLEVQRESGATLIFIAHDLSVVRFIADYVGVMYLGRLMEVGPAEAIYAPPHHPYTEALLAAVPLPDPDARQAHIRLSGSVPSALNPPTGCPFHTRCPRRALLPDGGAICTRETPPWRVVNAGTEDEHRIFCHLPLGTLASFAPVIRVQSTT